MSEAEEDTRKRQSFYPDPDNWTQIQEHVTGEHGEKNRLYNAAVRRYFNRPYTLEFPALEDEGREPDLDSASHGIIALGFTLYRFVTLNKASLERKVRGGVPLTVLIMAYDLGHNSCLYRMLTRRTGERQFVDDMRDQARASALYFGILHDIGLSTGARVRVLAFDEIISNGMVIRDHGFPDSRMRVSVYGDIAPHVQHPYWTIRRSDQDGAEAYDVYYRYYEGVHSRAKEIPQDQLLSLASES